MHATNRVLIVDDEPNIRSGLAKGLAREADQIETAGNVNEALSKLDQCHFPLVITDMRLPGDRNGLDLISEVLKRSPSTLVIVITAYGTVETAVDAMRRGAYDFILKPLDLNLIRQQTSKAFEYYHLREENHDLKSQLANAGEIAGIIGNSAALREVMRLIQQVADTDATILIRGESGTGKELIARALHDLSHRHANPFIAVNLGALPELLLESELFGHELGSFTGATRQKPGCFEQANRGTLFLDEIAEIPVKSQVDLLRVLETGQFRRIGGEDSMSSDARVVSATNRDIQELVNENVFREDLYYRLNIVPIEVPPLRRRRDDIPLLVDHFLSNLCKRHRRPEKSISDDAMWILTQANWPGNIRQLRNVIERLVVTVLQETIIPSHLPEELISVNFTETNAIVPLTEVADFAEKEAIKNALTLCDCHRERTADALGISVRTLHYKMNRYDLH